MESFAGRLAVVTGGGSGIGRALVCQLAEAGCHVAFCDLSEQGMQETLDAARAVAGGDVKLSAHSCDVVEEAELQRFRDEVMQAHGVEHINLLFNNAGVSGGQSFVRDDRAQWERTFAICWGGVYLGCRVFMPMLLASDAGHIINTSSVNGFWACLGGNTEHTAYSAAKFAVKGFSEALVVDLRLNAPHIGVSVVMPGHIGTGIAMNTQRLWHGEPGDMDAGQVQRARERMIRIDAGAAQLSDEQVRALVEEGGRAFRDNAPTSAEEAARIILDGVREDRWRILVGEDAVLLDKTVRARPEQAYDDGFFAFLDPS